MPKIVAYVHAYVPIHNAGAETTLHDLLRYLVTQGWEATVVVKPQAFDMVTRSVTEELPEYDIDGVHVIPALSRKAIVSHIATADITISHLECSKQLHLTSKKWGKPTIHLVHNTHPLTKMWSASADAMIYNTNWVKDHETFSDVTMPGIVIHPPVDVERYKTTRGKKITLVNLWKDKGSEIFYHLAKQMPEIEFLGVKGGYGEQLVQEFENVTIAEHTSDMKSIYGQSKLVLMPSKYESFGRVGVEAMASGIPVLAHPTAGLRESLGDAGTFIHRDLPAEWEKAVTDALKPAKYGKLSKLALARSQELTDQSNAELQALPMFLSELIRIKTGKRL